MDHRLANHRCGAAKCGQASPSVRHGPIEFRDGRIATYREYLDFGQVLLQLGVSPEACMDECPGDAGGYIVGDGSLLSLRQEGSPYHCKALACFRNLLPTMPFARPIRRKAGLRADLGIQIIDDRF
jgi:hypothetical protein